jgi:hypothetical protein
MLEEGLPYISQNELFVCKSDTDIRAKVSNYK